MYIPDLFGAYTKGRELAIDKNWQDLKNFESVEAQRNLNDLAAMDIWERRQQMPGKLSMYYDNVNSSSRANEVGEAGQRGMLALTNMGSDHAVNQYGVYKAYEVPLLQAIGSAFRANIDEQSNAATASHGRNAYFKPKAYQIGQDQAYADHQQTLANKKTASNLVKSAQQNIDISDANYTTNMKGSRLQDIQLQHSIDNQPIIQKNTKHSLINVIPARNALQSQIDAYKTAGATPTQIGSMYAVAFGDPRAQGIYELEQAGMLPPGTFQRSYAAQLGITQDLMGAGGATPTTTNTAPQSAWKGTPYRYDGGTIAPQQVNVSGKNVLTHPSGVITTSDGKVNFIMTPEEAKRRASVKGVTKNSKVDHTVGGLYHY